MLIIPCLPIRTCSTSRGKIVAFDSKCIGAIFVHTKRFRGKNFTVCVSFSDEGKNTAHIISGFDTKDEAQQEIDNIFTAVESDEQVYRCTGKFDEEI